MILVTLFTLSWLGSGPALAAPTTNPRMYELLDAILESAGLPAEQDPALDPGFELDERGWSAAQWEQHLRHFSGGALVEPWTTRTETGIDFFRDPGQKKMRDFSVRWSPPLPKPAGRHPEPGKALAGLTIALDPGHMGGDRWDAFTGKYIRNHPDASYRGYKKLSEGELALHTAFALRSKLQALGARVLLTRETLEPVTSKKPEELDLEQLGWMAIRQHAWSDWAQKALDPFAEKLPASGPLPAQLVSEAKQALRQNTDAQGFFSEQARVRYYGNGEDVTARVALLESWKPDLTISLHYDVKVSKEPEADPQGLQDASKKDSRNATKVYVPGGFLADELSQREDRAYFALHAARSGKWDESLRIATQVARALSEGLGIPFEEDDFGNSIRVAPGVFARNLALTRKLRTGQLIYIEALYYNYPSEFERLSAKQQGGNARIDEVAQSIASGLNAAFSQMELTQTHLSDTGGP